MQVPIIAPSVLSADFSALGVAVDEIDKSGAEWIHLDIMDGVFVPNLSFGPKTVTDLRSHSQSTFDVHLMTEHPEQFVAPFADAGADYITFHVEACVHSHRMIQSIKALGKKSGISLVPSTPLSFIEELMPLVDLVLIMTVNPGFGGQALLPECLAKAGRLVRLREKLGLNFLVSIDGGINSGTVTSVRNEHPDVLVTGSAFFAAKDKQLFIREMKGLC